MDNRSLYKIFFAFFVVNALATVYFYIFFASIMPVIFGPPALICLGLSIFARFYKKDIYLIVKIILLIIAVILFLWPWYYLLSGYIESKQGAERFKRIEEAEQQKKREECEEYKLKVPVETKDGQLIPAPTPPPPGCL